MGGGVISTLYNNKKCSIRSFIKCAQKRTKSLEKKQATEKGFRDGGRDTYMQYKATKN
jgi:hypothetical protein